MIKNVTHSLKTVLHCLPITKIVSVIFITTALLQTGCLAGYSLVGLESGKYIIGDTGTEFYIISYDGHGKEVRTPGGYFLSDRLAGLLADPQSGYTDVVFIAHGWQYDLAESENHYARWISKVRKTAGEIYAGVSDHDHKLLRIGIHWPSASRLRFMSFRVMKRRAHVVGAALRHNLLKKLQRASSGQGKIRFHLCGQSFGAIVLAEMLLGDEGKKAEVEPVDSLVMVQGAISTWAFCSRIPEPKNPKPDWFDNDIGPGYFWHIVRDKMVKGPIVVIYSRRDSDLRKWWRMGGQDRGQQPSAYRDPPPYGEGPNPEAAIPIYSALGAEGACGPVPNAERELMNPVGKKYDFAGGNIYNIDGTVYISGHMNFEVPQVAWIIIQILYLDEYP